jgi:hypothetical protein
MSDDTIDHRNDDELVDRLRRIAAEVDPVPDGVDAAARAAIRTRDLDRQLAVLVADSAAGEDPDLEWDRVAAFDQVRTGGATAGLRRLLSFAVGDVQVDLEVSGHGDRVDLIGQFTGASTEECVLEFADGAHVALEVDSLGRFLAAGVDRGALRARFRSAAGAPMTTAWVTI